MKPFECDYRVRSYETGVRNRLSLPSVCNYLQEAAGEHAEKLGFGILELQARGISWMLARLHLKLVRDVPWGTDVKVVTWPSGLKGRLVALRDFQIFATPDEGVSHESTRICTNQPGGRVPVLEGVSEWLTVDLAAQKIVKPSEDFARVVPPDVARVALAAADGHGKFAALAKVDQMARILVRRADHDFNDHVNNVHYVEWALEALPESFRARSVRELDIVFRQAAHAGDELESRVEIVDDANLRCAIVRPADGALLATAALTFANT